MTFLYEYVNSITTFIREILLLLAFLKYIIFIKRAQILIWLGQINT